MHRRSRSNNRKSSSCGSSCSESCSSSSHSSSNGRSLSSKRGRGGGGSFALGFPELYLPGGALRVNDLGFDSRRVTFSRVRGLFLLPSTQHSSAPVNNVPGRPPESTCNHPSDHKLLDGSIPERKRTVASHLKCCCCCCCCCS